MEKVYLIFPVIVHLVSAHHNIGDPWHVHFHEQGIFRTFFAGFFSTILLILGVLVFYYYCVRTGMFGRTFPLFPKKPIIPITIPFARAPNFLDTDRPETIVLTSATTSPSVFYSTKAHTNAGPWESQNPVTVKAAFPGYNTLNTL